MKHTHTQQPNLETALRRKKATNVSTGTNGRINVTLYSTVIVTIDREENRAILRTGGHKTATTKRRMNEVAKAYGLDFHVYQSKGKWYVDTPTFLEPEPITFTNGRAEFLLNDDTYSAYSC
jgi:hypothetical protein